MFLNHDATESMSDEKHEIRSVICHGCKNIDFPIAVTAELNGKQYQLCKICNHPDISSHRYVWGVCQSCQRKVVFNTWTLRWEHHDFDDDDDAVCALTGSDSEASGIGTVILSLAAGFLLGALIFRK